MLDLNPIFSDGMVLQRNKPINIFGKSDLPVTARLYHHNELICENRCLPDVFQNWNCILPAKEACKSCRIEIENCQELVIITNVFFGEVFLFNGQSNIGCSISFFLEQAPDYYNKKYKNLIQQENDDIHFFIVSVPDEIEWNNPLKDIWSNYNCKLKEHFSALASIFALEYSKLQSNIPVGIITYALGDTLCESYIGEEFFRKNARNLPIYYIYNEHIKNNYHYNNHKPFLMSSKLRQLSKYSFNSLVFYQGESNTLPEGNPRNSISLGCKYSMILQLYVDYIRYLWGSEIPVYIIQLPLFCFDNKDSSRGAQIRLAQYEVCCKNDLTNLIVSIDTGEYYEIHPANKFVLGKRIATLLYKSCSNGLKSYVFVSGYSYDSGNIVIFFENTKRIYTIYPKPEIKIIFTDYSIEYVPAVINKNTLEIEINSTKDIEAITYLDADDWMFSFVDDQYIPLTPFYISIAASNKNLQKNIHIIIEDK